MVVYLCSGQNFLIVANHFNRDQKLEKQVINVKAAEDQKRNIFFSLYPILSQKMIKCAGKSSSYQNLNECTLIFFKAMLLSKIQMILILP